MHLPSLLRYRSGRLFGWPAAFLCAAAAACADAPTGPSALAEYHAMWQAVLPSEQLPHPSAWLGEDAGSESLRRATVRVRRFEADAGRAFERGDVRRFAEARRAAVTVLSEVMTAPPPAAIVTDARAAIDAWVVQVGPTVSAGDLPALSAAFAEVVRARDGAAASLASADSVGAALALIDAAERIRASTPTLISLHVIGRAEARLAGSDGGARARERARHLLLGAREAVASGEPIRAVQRALYALQLAGGQEMVDAVELH